MSHRFPDPDSLHLGLGLFAAAPLPAVSLVPPAFFNDFTIVDRFLVFGVDGEGGFVVLDSAFPLSNRRFSLVDR